MFSFHNILCANFQMGLTVFIYFNTHLNISINFG